MCAEHTTAVFRFEEHAEERTAAAAAAAAAAAFHRRAAAVAAVAAAAAAAVLLLLCCCCCATLLCLCFVVAGCRFPVAHFIKNTENTSDVTTMLKKTEGPPAVNFIQVYSSNMNERPICSSNFEVYSPKNASLIDQQNRTS